MSDVRVPLLASSSGGEPVNSRSQRIYNLYPSPTAGKTGVVWKNTPGWSLWRSGTAEIKAMVVHKDDLYFVAGSAVMKRTGAGEETTIGTISSTASPIHMASDGLTMCVSNGKNIYEWDASTFTAVSLDAALVSPSGIIFHDGHFVVFDLGTGRFWISNKFEGTTWDALDFATAEDKPDNIVAIASDRVLWLFGEYTTQAYFNTGETFPFKPNPQGLMVYGMEGDTQEQLDNTSYWLGKSKQGKLKLMKAAGFTPSAVSTAALEEEWASFSNTKSAISNTIMWHGHEWYILTFPSEKRTFVYDTQGAWFEWGNYDSGLGRVIDHPMTHAIYFRDQNLFGTKAGDIYKLDKDVYNHDGGLMHSGFVSNVMHVDEQRMFLSSIIMDMRTGLGATTADANMEIRISYDGGNSFGSWLTRSLGRDGVFDHRVEWHRLGSGFNIVIQGRITDEFPRQIMSAVVGVGVYESYLDRRNDRSGV